MKNKFNLLLTIMIAGLFLTFTPFSHAQADETASIDHLEITRLGDNYISGYDDGPHWRIFCLERAQNHFIGTAVDKDENPVANTTFFVQVQGVLVDDSLDIKNGSLFYQAVTTDEEGKFNTTLNASSGIGNETYDTMVSIHHYDLVRIKFFTAQTNESQITAQDKAHKDLITEVYRLAYTEARHTNW